MSLVETAATWAVPRLLNCEVLKPEICAEVIGPRCVAVSEAKPLVLIDPIWVLVSALTTLVDSAATSAVLSPDRVVVERDRSEERRVGKGCGVLWLENT